MKRKLLKMFCAVLFCAVLIHLTACNGGISERGVSDTQIKETVNQSDCSKCYVHTCSEPMPTQLVAKKVEIDKRLTENNVDTVWAVVTLENDIMQVKAPLKMIFQKYTEGGWQCEEITYYLEPEFISFSLSESMANEIFEDFSQWNPPWMDGYSLLKLQQEGYSYTAIYDVNSVGEYSTVFGQIGFSFETHIDTDDESIVVYWTGDIDTSELYLDWSNLYGSWGTNSYDLTDDNAHAELSCANSGDGTICLQGSLDVKEDHWPLGYHHSDFWGTQERYIAVEWPIGFSFDTITPYADGSCCVESVVGYGDMYEYTQFEGEDYKDFTTYHDHLGNALSDFLSLNDGTATVTLHIEYDGDMTIDYEVSHFDHGYTCSSTYLSHDSGYFWDR